MCPRPFRGVSDIVAELRVFGEKHLKGIRLTGAQLQECDYSTQFRGMSRIDTDF